MKKVNDERLIAKQNRQSAFLLSIQIALMIIICIYDYFVHGFWYVFDHPLLSILFFTLIVSSIQQIVISNEMKEMKGSYKYFSIVAAFDLICIVIVLLNLTAGWIPLFIFAFIIISILAVLSIALMFQKKNQ